MVVAGSQLVQFVDVCEQVEHGESQLAHVPLLITRGEGQLATHDPLYNAAVTAHFVQLLVIPRQVAHTDAQGSQVLVTVLLMVIFSGQELVQLPLYI